MEYRVTENGTSYHGDTPEAVVRVLERAMKTGSRVRVWYGDTKTGRDWMESFDVCGYIGRSGGSVKIPLLVKTKRSMGGTALLDNRIVKITIDKDIVYRHPSYHQPELRIVDLSHLSKTNDYPYSVYAGDVCIRNCKTKKEAENEVAFHKGLRNVC